MESGGGCCGGGKKSKSSSNNNQHGLRTTNMNIGDPFSKNKS